METFTYAKYIYIFLYNIYFILIAENLILELWIII